MDRFPALKTFLFGAFVLVLGISLFETAYFIRVYLSSASTPGKTDMVLIYSGYEDRVGKYLDWAKADPSILFLFSGWDYQKPKLNKALGVEPSRVLVEYRARTTDQNARFCAPIIRAKGIHSVVLALPWYHLPRALFLTRLYLAGSGVTVTPYATIPLPEDWWKHREFPVELYKFWGSLMRIVLSWAGFDRPILHTY